MVMNWRRTFTRISASSRRPDRVGTERALLGQSGVARVCGVRMFTVVVVVVVVVIAELEQPIYHGAS